MDSQRIRQSGSFSFVSWRGNVIPRMMTVVVELVTFHVKLIGASIGAGPDYPFIRLSWAESLHKLASRMHPGADSEKEGYSEIITPCMTMSRKSS